MDDKRRYIEEWQWKAEKQRRERETFRRIHRLIKQGYVPDWTITDVEDAIWLDHPGASTNLQIYTDGTIVARGGVAKLDPEASEDHDRIYNDDEADIARFDRWLATVSLPTWRERTRAMRERYLWQPGCLVLMLAMFFIVAKALGWIWKSIMG